MNTSIISHLFVVFLITILNIIIYIFLDLIGVEPNELTIAIIASVILSFVLLFVFRKIIKKTIDTALMKIVLNTVATKSNKFFGFINIYKNLESVKKNLIKDFTTAKNVKLFLQLGKGIIGVGRLSFFFEEAMKQKSHKDFKLEILIADISSNYLAEARIRQRQTEYSEIQASVNTVELSLKALKSEGVNLEYKKHKEPYLWQLFIFDSKVYFLPYLYDKDNHEKSPVFEFNNIDQEGFAKLFNSYFNDVWSKY